MTLLMRHYVIAGLIFTLMVIGVVSTITLIEKGEPSGDGSEKVTNFMDEDAVTKMNRSLNSYDRLSSDINEMKENIKSLNPETTLEAITLPVAFIKSSWSVVKLIIDLFDFMTSAFTGVLGNLGVYVPSWVADIIILIVSTFLVFSIISLIFGKDT